MSDPRPEPTSPVDRKELAAGREAAAYINGLIRGPAGPTQPRAPSDQRRRGRERLARMRRFLDALGNPQADLPVVLVAGTSGKGSVAVKIAAGLRAAGYSAGLHVTPYLQTPLEKFWLDGRLARPGELADLAAWARPVVERADPRQPPTYGMVWVALTFEYFRRAGVDALVLEVGAGGRFDLTNVCDPLLNVITTVGMDHEKSLGPSLSRHRLAQGRHRPSGCTHGHRRNAGAGASGGDRRVATCRVAAHRSADDGCRRLPCDERPPGGRGSGNADGERIQSH